jgi:hypothetical protein
MIAGVFLFHTGEATMTIDDVTLALVEAQIKAKKLVSKTLPHMDWITETLDRGPRWWQWPKTWWIRRQVAATDAALREVDRLDRLRLQMLLDEGR